MTLWTDTIYMDMTIRNVSINDTTDVIRILNNIIKKRIYTVFDIPFSEEEEKKYIECFPKRGIFIVGENKEKKIVGFHSMEPFAANLSAFNHVGIISTFVDLCFVRNGIGKMLLNKSCQIGKEKGFEKYYAYVRADNKNALNFYLKQGFYVVGTAKKQAKIYNEYIDEIIIEKLL